MNYAIRILSLLTVFSGLAGCTPDQPVQNAEELIIGHWELSQATRNEQPTKTLENLYFDFFQDSVMRTNFPNRNGETRYRIKENRIEQFDTEAPLSLDIKEVSDSTLVLDTEIRDFRFRLSMKRVLQQN